MKTYIYIIFTIMIVSMPIFTVYAITTLDNGRREYGYCPIAPETMLSRAQFEINGCPITRVYISNWNNLSDIEKITIDTQMRNSGFKDIGEFDSRAK